MRAWLRSRVPRVCFRKSSLVSTAVRAKEKFMTPLRRKPLSHSPPTRRVALRRSDTETSWISDSLDDEDLESLRSEELEEGCSACDPSSTGLTRCGKHFAVWQYTHTSGDHSCSATDEARRSAALRHGRLFKSPRCVQRGVMSGWQC